MLLRVLLLIAVFLVVYSLNAQYDRYSLYHYTSARINPAYLATGNDAVISFLHRNQRSLPGIEINSSYVSVKYPFVRKNSACSGVGVDFVNSQEGIAGIFQTNAVGAGYGLNIPIRKLHSLSAGLSIHYFQRSINTTELLTGNQYVDGFGFDPTLNPGEELDLYRVQYLSANWGVRWEALDKRRRPQDHFGVALFNLNKPSESFISNKNTRLPIVLIAEGSKRVHESKNWLFDLEAYLQSDAASSLWMVGGSSKVDLASFDRRLRGQSTALYLRYLHFRGIQVGLEWENELFAIASSYELPMTEDVAQNGAFEIGLRLKKQVKARNKRRRGRIRRLPPGARRSTSEEDELTIIGTPDSLTAKDIPDTDLVSPIGEVDTSKVYIIHIEFEFASTKPILSRETRSFIEQLAAKLRNDPDLAITIIGHTDNVGTHLFNQQLSEKRASAVYNLLIMRGVSFSQMGYSGKGERQPLVDNTTEQDRAKNRRVEIRFIANE